MTYSRRFFIKTMGVVGGGLVLPGSEVLAHQFRGFRRRPAGILDANLIPKYEMPLLIPPAMPGIPLNTAAGKAIDYYEIALRQIKQQVLPLSMRLPRTTVLGYGVAGFPSTFQWPTCSIEAKYNRPVRVKWINQMVDAFGNYQPHFLPIDQTLHWANPPAGAASDSRGSDPTPYTGPVPMVTHLHGVHATEENDGYPESWFLPKARNIPAGYATGGQKYAEFAAEFKAKWGQAWEPGASIYQYPNDQRATTLWFHDHTLGMTRINVYGGTAGFYLLRGGPDDNVLDARNSKKAVLPGPAPAVGDPAGKAYFEIPLLIQDRTFNRDGSLFFPDNRAYFEGLSKDQLQIPFIPQDACGGPSDISPIWNPEFFGTTMVVNGQTWPFLKVQARRYRFRILNGCNARTVMLGLGGDAQVPFWRIGADGGFIAAPVQQNQLLLMPAERADVIVDFTGLAGKTLEMTNVAPDSPFGGGTPGVDFDPSDPNTTGQVMQFKVVAAVGPDPSTPPASLILPAIQSLGRPGVVRRVSLNELESSTVKFSTDANGNQVLDCASGVPFGPEIGLLGTADANGAPMPMMWSDPVTETPIRNQTELWEIYNYTEDAHPVHLHQTMFQVVERETIGGGNNRGPDDGESGFKDTVIAYPGEITRLKIRFDLKGLHVWHCHIIDHEDNEMMRPLLIT
jgi:spore coat protein A, manganese oxidase